MNLNNSYPLPRVDVSGKYEIIIDTGAGEVLDSMWLFKDDRGTRTNLKIKKVGQMLEPYLPLKAEDMDADGVLGIYEAMIVDARKDVAVYRKGLADHLMCIQDATIAWYDSLYDDMWSDDWEALQKTLVERDRYINRSFQTYRKAIAFLKMMHCEMVGGDLDEKDIA